MMSTSHVKKTISLPRDLVDRLKVTTANLSAFIAEACRDKLLADEKRAREKEMIERCRVRYAEDLALAGDFFELEQEVWDSAP